MKISFIDLKREAKLIKNELLNVTEDIILSGNYIGGKNVDLFEDKFSKFCGVSNSVSVGNGSDGLKIIMKALDIGNGDEVICPANSFIASAWSIFETGATPVYCDVEDDLLMSIRTIDKCKTLKTKAIMAVHLTGKLCDLDNILDYCTANNILLIEDAAQSIGATNSKNKKAGSFGIASSFSLHPLKNLAVYGDGGIITTNSKDLAKEMKIIRNHGLINRDESIRWGLNSRLDELQAAYGLVKLNYIDSWNKKHVEIADRYNRNISNKVIKPRTISGHLDIYHNYIIQVPIELRDLIIESLLELGVETKIHYPIPLHLQKCSSELGYKNGDIQNVERLAKTMISLPIYHTLDDNEINYIIESVNTVINKLIG